MQPLWLLDSIGSRLIRDEQQTFLDFPISSFANYFLQLGIWGHSNTFIYNTPIDNSFLITTENSFGEIDLVADLDRLPLQARTVDVVFLPHTLERFDNHLDILRASANIINEKGTLIAFGFNPSSLWGFRYWLSGNLFLPDIQRIISPNLYTNWLLQLGFRVEKIHYFHAIIPLRRRLELPLKNKILNPFLCACYMIVARKEIIPLTLENEFINGNKQASSLADSMSRSTI